ncbi:MAG: hypothetical protein ABWW69_05440 [Pyrodictiaceae archaeon]
MRRSLLIKLAKILPVLPLILAIAKLAIKASAAAHGPSIQPEVIIYDEWDVGV